MKRQRLFKRNLIFLPSTRHVQSPILDRDLLFSGKTNSTNVGIKFEGGN